MDSKFSSRKEYLYGVSQGFMLGPILLNIFICDMFLVLDATFFAGYEDHNTLFFCQRPQMKDVLSALH